MGLVLAQWDVGMCVCVCKKTRALVSLRLLCFSYPQGIVGVRVSHPPLVLVFSKAFLT